MINLLPYKQKKIIELIRFLRIIKITLIAIIILAITSVALFFPSLITINNHFTLARHEFKTLEMQGVVLKPTVIEVLDSRVRVLTEKLAFPTTPSPTEYVALIRSIAQSSIILSGFTMEKAGTAVVAVSGVASTRETLQSFVESLQKNESIMSVDSPLSNYIKSKNNEFRITVTFKPV